jgi:hypothetical protein
MQKSSWSPPTWQMNQFWPKSCALDLCHLILDSGEGEIWYTFLWADKKPRSCTESHYFQIMEQGCSVFQLHRYFISWHTPDAFVRLGPIKARFRSKCTSEGVKCDRPAVLRILVLWVQNQIPWPSVAGYSMGTRLLLSLVPGLLNSPEQQIWLDKNLLWTKLRACTYLDGNCCCTQIMSQAVQRTPNRVTGEVKQSRLPNMKRIQYTHLVMLCALSNLSNQHR